MNEQEFREQLHHAAETVCLDCRATHGLRSE